MTYRNPGSAGACVLLTALSAVAALLAGCGIPPIVYHDGMPAYTLATREIGGAVGLHSGWWTDSAGNAVPVGYFNFGARTGQQFGRLALEEGIFFSGLSFIGLQAGIGLDRPALMLRGTWFPFRTGSDGLPFYDGQWWQAALLAGVGRKARGWGLTAGARASPFGIGPVALVEYSFNDESAIRAEVSRTWPAPWAGPRVAGSVVTFGLTAEPRGKVSRRKP